MNEKLLSLARDAWRYHWIKNTCTNKVSLYDEEGVEGVELEFKRAGYDLDEAIDDEIEQYGDLSDWNKFLAAFLELARKDK